MFLLFLLETSFGAKVKLSCQVFNKADWEKAESEIGRQQKESRRENKLRLL
jgi:hypothetical protein